MYISRYRYGVSSRDTGGRHGRLVVVLGCPVAGTAMYCHEDALPATQPATAPAPAQVVPAATTRRGHAFLSCLAATTAAMPPQTESLHVPHSPIHAPTCTWALATHSSHPIPSYPCPQAPVRPRLSHADPPSPSLLLAPTPPALTTMVTSHTAMPSRSNSRPSATHVSACRPTQNSVQAAGLHA